MTVLIDTGVFYAAAAERDLFHGRAVELLRGVEDQRPFTTDHVIVETWALLNARFDHATAMRFWSGLRGSAFDVEFVAPPDLERAHAICEAWADQRFDLVDCTSFAVMERVGCRRVATFDNDFAIFRTGIQRRESFEIVR